MITDVSGLPGLKVEKTRVVLPGVCHRAAEQIVVRDSVSIEPPRPPARRVPDTQVEACIWLPVNTRLTVLSQTQQWLRVRLADGREGYVYGLFVRC